MQICIPARLVDIFADIRIFVQCPPKITLSVSIPFCMEVISL